MVAGCYPAEEPPRFQPKFVTRLNNGDDAHEYRLLGMSVALAFIAVWSEWFMRRRKNAK